MFIPQIVADGRCKSAHGSRSDHHGGNDDPTLIANYAAWMKSSNVAWASYFNFNDGGLNSTLSAFPNSLAAYKADLGGVDSSPSTAPAPATTPTTAPPGPPPRRHHRLRPPRRRRRRRTPHPRRCRRPRPPRRRRPHPANQRRGA